VIIFPTLLHLKLRKLIEEDLMRKFIAASLSKKILLLSFCSAILVWIFDAALQVLRNPQTTFIEYLSSPSTQHVYTLLLL